MTSELDLEQQKNPSNTITNPTSNTTTASVIPPTADPATTQQTEYLNTSMPLPQPPENPANTVPSKTLWMGDIESWWDEEYISHIWANLDKNVQVKVIKPKQGLLMHQLAKNNGQGMINHSGYCFVEFETPEDATEALSLNGTAISQTNNKTFRLNWASAATLSSQVAQTPEYSLFVGDLSPGTTEAHLLALFQSRFNSVKTLRVMTDPSSGLSRCFGFVRFSNQEDRKRALVEMNGQWLGGRQIRVALATPKHQSMGYQKNQSSNQNAMTLDPLEAVYMSTPGGPMTPIGYYPFGNQGPPSNSQAFNDPNNTTVFVGGLANGVSEETLMALFEPFGSIINIKVPQGKGCGFVRFSNRENAENAIQGMQGFVIAGSRIRLSWGRSNNRNQSRQQHLQHGQQQGQHQMMSMSRPVFDYPPNVQSSMAPNNQQGSVEGYPNQGTPQGTHATLVGIPAGLPPPMFYDPYFAAQQQGSPLGSVSPDSGMATVVAQGMGPGSSGMMDPQEGMPMPPPQQFAIDQNGQYMYLPQPFPNAMMQGGIPGQFEGSISHEQGGDNEFM